jgi:hypothetical protein
MSVKWKLSTFALTVLTLLFTGTLSASAADSHRVEPSSPTTVDEFGVCRIVTNFPPNLAIYVPTKTSSEWSYFYNHLPSNVTVGACPPAEASYEGNYTGSYTSNYTSTYTGTYTPSYETSYTGSYEPTYTGSYEPTYTGSYEPGYTGSYTSTYTSTYEAIYDTFPVTSSYTGSYEPTYTGTYTASYETGYTGSYEGGYEGGYTGSYTGSYESGYTTSYEDTYEPEPCDPLEGPGTYHCDCVDDGSSCPDEPDPYADPFADPPLCGCGQSADCTLSC